MSQRWYVLRSKPRKEELLVRQLAARGLPVFYPYVQIRRVNPRARSVAPYFPGYLFVSVDLTRVGSATFAYMPNALGLVAFGGEPAPVETALVERLRAQVVAGTAPMPHLRPGDRVEITGGPFAGYEAIFDARISGGERVRVLLTMLGERVIRAELGAEQIRPTTY